MADSSYPRSTADEMISAGIADHAASLALLEERIAPESREVDHQISPPPSSDEFEGQTFLDCPFQAIYDMDQMKAVGDVGLLPHGYHFSEKKYTPEEVRA